MDIFAEIKSLSESTIVRRLGLQPARDNKSWICPICQHGKGGDGLRYRNGRWECYGGCHRSRSNVDLIAACYNLDTTDKAKLATKLREIMGYEVEKETSFSFQRKKEPVKKVAHVVEDRDFAPLYKRCRINYSLKDFVEKCGGSWRGLTYETLKSAGCLFHAEYTISEGVCVPVVIVPYDNSLYYWRRVDDVPDGERKGSVPKGSTRKPYIAAPMDDIVNFIVEGELDALSIKQALGSLKVGIVATGGANFIRQTVAEVERQFGDSERKPWFIVLFDNDGTGVKQGEILTSALQARKFPAVQVFFEERLKGDYIRYCRGEETKFFQPKIDANDILQRGEDVLRDRLFYFINNFTS